jgi:two-component system, NarL family, sensor histidine kinase UhpB
MSLRGQVNLLVAALIWVFLAAVLALQIVDTRNSVREEVEAANRVATQLLGYYVESYAYTGQQIVLESLERLGRVRSNDITLRDLQGVEIYKSPPSTYKAGRNAPAWYATLVMPQPMHSELHFADSILHIEANATRAVLDGWDDAVRLLQAGLVITLLGNVLAFRLVKKATEPFQVIVHGLTAMERGAYETRLPTFRAAEAGAMANAFNRMAQAIQENLSARREAQTRLEQSRELALLIQTRIEEERREIARELHDETGQSVTAIKSLALSLTQRAKGNDEQMQQTAQLIADTAGHLYGAMHDLIPRLRPLALDSLGLADAVEDRVAQWRHQYPDVEFALSMAAVDPGLGDSYALAAYRILQEATTNALRHAQAHRIAIHLRTDADALLLEVCDDGCGLQEDWQRPGHYGVRGMQERAQALGGEVIVENVIGGGVRVCARLPLE